MRGSSVTDTWLDSLIVWGLWPIAAAPFWLPPIMWFMSPRAVFWLFVALWSLWVASFVFLAMNLSDDNPYGVITPGFPIGGATWLLLVAGWTRLAIGVRNWWREKRQKQANDRKSDGNRVQFGLKFLLVVVTLAGLVAGAIYNGVRYEFFVGWSIIIGLVSVPVAGLLLWIAPGKAKYALIVAVLGLGSPVLGAGIYIVIHEGWQILKWYLAG